MARICGIWYPEGFAQFVNADEELFSIRSWQSHVRTLNGMEALLWVYPRLNRITLDDLQRALQAGGFVVSRLSS